MFYNNILKSSIKDMFKFKSILMIVFCVVFLDKASGTYLKPYIDQVSVSIDIDSSISSYIFNDFPVFLMEVLSDYKSQLILFFLFVLKLVVSLWPTSGLRLVHKGDNSKSYFVKSVSHLRLSQVMLNVSIDFIILFACIVWEVFSFAISYLLWKTTGSELSVLVLGLMIFMMIPFLFAGFSFSSNVVVMSNLSNLSKFRLFFKIYLDVRCLIQIWLFFLFRALVEIVFVISIPLYAILYIDDIFQKILIASISITIPYTTLKMMSFKFFLHVFENEKEIKNEFSEFYKR